MAGDGRSFEFGWLEVLGLIVIFAFGSAVVFFSGVFVGLDLKETDLAKEERVIRIPVAGIPRADAPAPAPAPDEELPLYDRLARPAATQAVNLAVRGPQPLPTARPELAPTALPVGGPAILPTAVRGALPPLPTAVPAFAALDPGGVDAAGSFGKWAVQVNATKDRATAKGLVQRLRSRGYSAYDIEVSLRGETWYRVRVGRFPTMEEATAVVVRLKNQERYSRAFLVEE